ncbi:MAG: signal peptidase II, partial [Hungatella sp.]
MKEKTKQIIGFLIGLTIAIGLDQWTKRLAVSHLKGQEPQVIWNGVFEFFYSENRGAAFGMLQGKQTFFFLVAAIVMIAVVYVIYRMPTQGKYLPLVVCSFLIAAGAIGNMIDRISQGYVVDFLYFKLINFPIFNLADCYVTVATACLMIL